MVYKHFYNNIHSKFHINIILGSRFKIVIAKNWFTTGCTNYTSLNWASGSFFTTSSFYQLIHSKKNSMAGMLKDNKQVFLILKKACKGNTQKYLREWNECFNFWNFFKMWNVSYNFSAKTTCWFKWYSVNPLSSNPTKQ